MTTRILLPTATVFCLIAAWAACPRPCHAQSRKALAEARNDMVDEKIVAEGVKNPRVIRAMRATPRHEFISRAQYRDAYLDMALPIGSGQTISPPFIVAWMTEQLDPQPTDKVLEIGTGSGYQAAVLSELVDEVYTIEIVEPLGRKAKQTLHRLGYDNVQAKVGDGYKGWPENAPFDKIIVTCSPENIPQPLVSQLREGGRIVVPVGQRYQQTLFLYKKVEGRLVAESRLPAFFVPMTGEAESQREVLPDPTQPALINGSFEQLVVGTQKPVGWHYQRGMQLKSGDAPSGDNYITFRNEDRDREAWTLQAFAVDGRKVRQIDIALRVRGKDVWSDPGSDQWAALVVIFYDERRATLGTAMVGPWRGTFDWKMAVGRISVPPRTRDAIVRIGLLGAVGELSMDNIQLRASPRTH